MKVDYAQPQTQTAEPANRGFGSEFLHSLKISVIATIVLGVIVSGVYPLVVWGLAQALFSNKANGSLIDKNGKPTAKDADAVASSLIGQNFSAPQYFHPRPSAAGNGYDPTASSGSNLGPMSAKLLHGTTKNMAITIFAFDKTHTLTPVSGRVVGAVTAVTATTITVTPAGGTAATYTLDPSVADPNTVVNSRGRTIHATTLAAGTHAGAIVELKLNDKTPPAVTAINVIDQELDATANVVDTKANTITLAGDSPTVINVLPDKTAIVVNGKTDAKLGDITAAMSVHAVVSVVMDYDGLADRVVHYCEDNNIDYQCSIASSVFKDADGIDDSKLNQALNGATTTPTITPAKLIPGDAVTASGSGLDPHISTANAMFQAQRVADARKIALDKVKTMIGQCTDEPSLGILGDAGVNVVRLNIALDKDAPMPPATPTPTPTTAPTTAPSTAPATQP